MISWLHEVLRSTVCIVGCMFQRKMMVIAQMLDIPTSEATSILQPTLLSSSLFNSTQRPLPGQWQLVDPRLSARCFL